MIKQLFYTEIFGWAFETDEAVKSKLKIALDSETIPFLLPKLESWAKKNGGYLATGKVYTILYPIFYIETFLKLCTFSADLG